MKYHKRESELNAHELQAVLVGEKSLHMFQPDDAREIEKIIIEQVEAVIGQAEEDCLLQLSSFNRQEHRFSKKGTYMINAGVFCH